MENPVCEMSAVPTLKKWHLPRSFEVPEDAMVITRSEFEAAQKAGQSFDALWEQKEANTAERGGEQLAKSGDLISVVPHPHTTPSSHAEWGNAVPHFYEDVRACVADAFGAETRDLILELEATSHQSPDRHYVALEKFAAACSASFERERDWTGACGDTYWSTLHEMKYDLEKRIATAKFGGDDRRSDADQCIFGPPDEIMLKPFEKAAGIYVRLLYGFTDQVLTEGEAEVLDFLFDGMRDPPEDRKLDVLNWLDHMWNNEANRFAFARLPVEEMKQQDLPPWLGPLARCNRDFSVLRNGILENIFVGEYHCLLDKLGKIFIGEAKADLKKRTWVELYSEETEGLGAVHEMQFLDFYKAILQSRQASGKEPPWTSSNALELRIVFQEEPVSEDAVEDSG
ncbi:unnamed protein product [Amoebophrya sp. A120]|nr:unnamed protein product [Amoebophrya sp. A120]|eukprot:GSA120T00003376001.1